MIYADSRYVSGRIYKTYNVKRDARILGVSRTWPTAASSFFYYVWRERDRMDLLAYNYLGSPDLWWQIMDYNPELADAFNISVGTIIRIPYA